MPRQSARQKTANLRLALAALVLLASALEGWYGQPELFGDDISYLDVVNMIRLGDWKTALNPLWSIGYPLLLSVVRLVFPDNIAGEMHAVFCLNVAISFARSERRRSERRAPDGTLAEIDRAMPVPAENARVERLAEIVAEMGELDKALVLLYLDGEPYETIASIVGLSETNVATKLSRLKRRIKERLERDEAVAEGDERGTR